MRTSGLVFVFFVVICLALFVSPVMAVPLGGQNYVTFYCDVGGASVYLDGSFAGVISGGYLDVPNGNTYSSYRVTQTGYYDATGTIDFIPGGPSNIDISVTLSPKPVGSGQGWITVHSNVDGATVAFDGVTKGTIANGVFTLGVYSTGSPFSSISVSKSGYIADTEPVYRMPAAGQTVDIYATINPVPTQSTVATPIGGDTGYYVIHSNVDGASVYLDSTYKGSTTNGVLSILVYSTGTPYTMYRVEKNGYVTVTGRLPASPGRGQTVPVYVTLTMSYSPTAVPTTAKPTTALPPLGSGQGYIVIHANVEGAKVTIGDYITGTIHNGVYKATVSTTGTPFSSFTISNDGYTTVTGTIPRQPAVGETVDVYATLNPVPTTVPTTKAPVPAWVPVTAVIGALLVTTALSGRNGKNS